MADNGIDHDRQNLDKAKTYKEQANKEYAEENYQNAMMLYHRCLLHARAVAQLSNANLQMLARNERDGDSGQSSSTSADQTSASGRSRLDSSTRGEEMKEESRDVIAKCYNNLAACLLKKSDCDRDAYERVILYCDKVLDIYPDNDKARYRKGLAYMKLGKYEKAIEFFESCPTDCSSHIAECNNQLNIERKKRDDKIRANFAKARQQEELRNGDVPPAQRNGNAMNGSAIH